MSDESKLPIAGAEAGTGEDRQQSFSRRAMLHAGWSVPVILAVAPPKAFAQSPSHTDSHGDTHDDTHGDSG